MNNTVVDRDERQQKEFSITLITFETEMRAVCKSLKGHIVDARDNIQEDNAAQALDYLIELIEQIEGELPGIVDFGSQQKKYAGHIEDAKAYRFSRR